jgi:hypothetical protein
MNIILIRSFYCIISENWQPGYSLNIVKKVALNTITLDIYDFFLDVFMNLH